jgi:hypothetical protein
MIWRPPDREDRQVAALWAVCAGLVLLLRPIWIAAAGVLPPCAWHAWTGWPCPGCGATRAILSLLRGDPVGAIAWNPLAACGAVVFVAGGLAAPAWFALGGQRPAIPSAHRTAWGAAAVLALVANWSWIAVSGV